MEYSHAPRFRLFALPEADQSGETLEEEFRENLFSASICLAIYARLRAALPGEESGEDNPWGRLTRFLDEVNADLRESTPYGDQLIGWATLLSIVSESLRLQEIDPDFQFLLSLFIESCLLLELQNGESWNCGVRHRDADGFRTRIQASLDFIVEELAERRRRERRATSRTVAAA